VLPTSALVTPAPLAGGAKAITALALMVGAFVLHWTPRKVPADCPDSTDHQFR